MNEEWLQIEDTDYCVSNLGRVASPNIILKSTMNNQGYLYVDLFVSSVRQRYLVHRLVAIAFLPDRKEMVNHINGNKQDNRLENLEWVTASENTKHSYAMGLQAIGQDKTLAILTDKDVLEIQELFEQKSMMDRDIAIRYGVTSGVISSIRLGKTWTHVSGKVFERSGPNPVKKLTPEAIPEIRAMFKEGFSDAEIGRKYKVARGTINQIRQGKTWINY